MRNTYVCRTSGPDGLPSYAVITLSRGLVMGLLRRFETFDRAKATEEDLSCLEYRAYGVVQYLDNLGTETDDWVELEETLTEEERDPNPREGLPGYVKVPDEYPTPEGADDLELERLVVLQDECYWCTDMEHCDGTAETKTISRQTLKRWLRDNKD